MVVVLESNQAILVHIQDSYFVSMGDVGLDLLD